MNVKTRAVPQCAAALTKEEKAAWALALADLSSPTRLHTVSEGLHIISQGLKIVGSALRPNVRLPKFSVQAVRVDGTAVVRMTVMTIMTFVIVMVSLNLQLPSFTSSSTPTVGAKSNGLAQQRHPAAVKAAVIAPIQTKPAPATKRAAAPARTQVPTVTHQPAVALQPQLAQRTEAALQPAVRPVQQTALAPSPAQQPAPRAVATPLTAPASNPAPQTAPRPVVAPVTVVQPAPPVRVVPPPAVAVTVPVVPVVRYPAPVPPPPVVTNPSSPKSNFVAGSGTGGTTGQNVIDQNVVPTAGGSAAPHGTTNGGVTTMASTTSD